MKGADEWYVYTETLLRLTDDARSPHMCPKRAACASFAAICSPAQCGGLCSFVAFTWSASTATHVDVAEGTK